MSDIQKTKLAPCPFCGGDKIFSEFDDGSGCVECENCGAYAFPAPAWNHRPIEDQLKADLGEMVDEIGGHDGCECHTKEFDCECHDSIIAKAAALKTKWGI